MIVIDTSIWVDHFRREDDALKALIADGVAMLHPFVLGELLLGGLPGRSEVTQLLRELAPAPLGTPEEAAALIEWGKLAGTGVGYVDSHLLLSARLIESGMLLTGDRNLHAQAARLGVAYDGTLAR